MLVRGGSYCLPCVVIMKAVSPSSSLALLLLISGILPATAQEGGITRPRVPFAGLDELTFLKSGDPLVDWNSKRTWTSVEGRPLKAKILSLKDGLVDLELETGKTTTLPVTRLIPEDQRFIREWEALSVYFNLSYEPPRSIANTIEPGIFDGAFAKEGRIHETRNFRFECDAVLTQEVVKDFSRLFEVTYLAVLANPLGLAIAEPEGGKFQVRLFSRDSDYLNAGGNADAAGVYLIKDRVMLVPLSSLGLTPGSSGYKKTLTFDPRTLIHETTHALTHQWLACAPMWFVEGFAEYIAAIPYTDGRLELSRHRGGLLALATKKFGGDPARFDLIDPDQFTGISHQVFMGEPEPEEPLIQLPRVEPFQITFVSDEKKTGDPVGDSGSVKNSDMSSTGTLVPPPTGPVVLKRYISSMTLIHHLISSGQTADFRSYLFDFARFEWDLDRYLGNFEKTLKAHQTAVQGQVRECDAEFKRFNAAVDDYNREVDRYNKRELKTPPTIPVEPVIPGPLPVPEILSRPRSASELSRKQFLESAWARHLRCDGGLSLQSLQ